MRFAARPEAKLREHRPEIGQEVELMLDALSGVTGVLLAFREPDRCLVEVGGLAQGVLLNLPHRAVRRRFDP
jgi:hypothetical protein